MPRLRKQGASLDARNVPIELLDKGDPVWQSRTATLAWFKAYELDAPPSTFLRDWSVYGPANRHREACAVWARSVGVVNATGGTHWGKLRELGIPGHGGDVAIERFKWSGVRVREGGADD